MFVVYVDSQLQKSPCHMVRLACKAKYGYEYLYVELSKEFNMKVNIHTQIITTHDTLQHITI